MASAWPPPRGWRADGPAPEIVGAVMGDLDAFVAGTPQHDDITRLVVSVNGLV